MTLVTIVQPKVFSHAARTVFAMAAVGVKPILIQRSVEQPFVWAVIPGMHRPAKVEAASFLHRKIANSMLVVPLSALILVRTMVIAIGKNLPTATHPPISVPT